jgi:hypothetical protein
MRKLLIALIGLLASGAIFAACPAGSTCQTFAAFVTGVSSATTLAGTELFPCLQSSATVSCTPAQLLTYMSTASFPIGGTTPAGGAFTTLSGSGLIVKGTKFTIAATGCTPSATTGGATAGTITLASGPCTSIVITMNGATGLTAPNGWKCSVGDRTAQAAGTYIPEWYENSSTTTTATIPIPAAAGATDVISFACTGF